MPGDFFGLSFWVGLLAWIPATGLILVAVRQMIMTELSGAGGLFVISAAIGLAVMAVKPPQPGFGWVYLLLLVGFALMVPVAGHVVEARAHAKIDQESIAKVYRSLQVNPKDLGAIATLAKKLHERGLPGHAIAILENALQGQSGRGVKAELDLLKYWKGQPLRQEDFRPLPCSKCGHKNPAGVLFCVGCRSPYLRAYASSWVYGGPGEKLLVAWGLLTLGTVAIPWGIKLLPPIGSILLISAFAVISLFILVWAFRRGDRA